MTKKQLKEYISNNQPDELIKYLKGIIIKPSGLYDELTEIEANLEDYSKKSRLGIESTHHLQISKAKIDKRLLDILDNVFINKEDLQLQPNYLSSLQTILKELLKDPFRHSIIWVLIVVILLFLFRVPVIYGSHFKFINWATWDSYFLGLSVIILIGIIHTKVSNLNQKRIKVDFSPYSALKGLHPFEKNDTEVFRHLQRQDDLRNVINGLIESEFKFGVLSGESGCGKTSFINAGLGPLLDEKGISYILTKVTNQKPLKSINEALIRKYNFLDEKKDTEDLIPLLTVIQKGRKAEQFIIILDQFEQFFTLDKDKTHRRIFIDKLNEAIIAFPELKILVSIRGDFMGSLYEIQQIINFPLTVNKNYFNLKKFNAHQAAKIIEVIANSEQMEFNKVFVEELCKTDLTFNTNGLISPIDIQLLAFIIKGQQKTPQAFTRRSFQSMGGIDGLLQRFLQEQLSVPNFYNKNQAALKVLLAFIDLTNNVRIGELTIKEIKEKASDKFINTNLNSILDWLEGLRLVTKITNSSDELKYELAHDGLIPALNILSGQQLKKVERANQLLNKRTNEWLANEKKARFLPTFREYWLIRNYRKQHLIRWGKNKVWKEVLLKATRKRLIKRLMFFGVPWVIFLIGFGIKNTSWYIFNYEIPQSYKALLQNHLSLSDQDQLLEETLRVNPKLGFKIALDISDEKLRDKTLHNIIREEIKLNKLDSLEKCPPIIYKAIGKIIDPYLKAKSFIRICKAHEYFSDTQNAKLFLNKSIDIVSKIDKTSNQVEVFQNIAVLASQLKEETIFQRVLDSLDSVDLSYYANESYEEIAVALTESDENKGLELLIEHVSKIPNSERRDYLLKAIIEQVVIKTTESSVAFDLKLINKIEDEKRQFKILITSVNIAANILKDTTLAKTQLYKGKQVNDQIKEVYTQSRNLLRLVSTSCEIKDTLLAKSYLNQVSSIYSQIKDLNNEISILDEIGHWQLKLGLEKNGQTSIEQLFFLCSKIKDPYLKILSYNRLLSPRREFKEFVKNEEVIDLALSEVKRIKNGNKKISALRNIIQGTLEIVTDKSLERALKIFAEIEKGSERSNILRNIYRAAANSCNDLYLKKIRTIISQEGIDQLRNFPHRNWLPIIIETGDMDFAQYFLNSALEKASLNLDSRSHVHNISGLVAIACQINDTTILHPFLRRAMYLGLQTDQPKEKENFASQIISNLNRNENYESIAIPLQAINKIRPEDQRLNAIKKAKSALNKNNKKQLKYLEQIPTQMRQPINKVLTWHAIANISEKLDLDTAQIIIYLKTAFNLTKLIEDKNDLANCYNRLIKLASRVGAFDFVYKIQSQCELEFPISKPTAYLEAMTLFYLQTGRRGIAYELAQTIPLHRPKVKVYVYLNLIKSWETKKQDFSEPITY